MNKSATRSLILIISLLAMLALTWSVQAQTPTSREALEQTIQAAPSRATGPTTSI
jgi:hypothetical protein